VAAEAFALTGAGSPLDAAQLSAHDVAGRSAVEAGLARVLRLPLTDRDGEG
jgi:hypothetical protein